jgi:hypothetical protein
MLYELVNTNPLRLTKTASLQTEENSDHNEYQEKY